MPKKRHIDVRVSEAENKLAELKLEKSINDLKETRKNKKPRRR
jgi:hypothetical protein